MKYEKIFALFFAAISMTACVDQSLYEKQNGDEIEQKIPNSFDFSTVQKVKLNVDILHTIHMVQSSLAFIQRIQSSQ